MSENLPPMQGTPGKRPYPLILAGHTDSVRSLNFSHNSQYVVAGSENGIVRIWNAQTGECLKTLEGHTDHIRSSTFSPDGKLLVTGSNDKAAKIWNIETGGCLKTLIHTESVRVSTFTSNNKYVITESDDDGVCIWDIETGKCINIPRARIDYIIFSTSSHTDKIVINNIYTKIISIWDVEAGGCQEQPEDYINDYASFNSNAEFSIISYFPAPIPHVRHTEAKRCIDLINRTYLKINYLALSPDNEYVLFSHEYLDKVVRIWNVETTSTINSPVDLDGYVYSSSFSPDGQFVVIGYSDGRVVIHSTR